MSFKELTSEEEEKLIDKLAEEIVKRGLEFPASLVLEMYQPVAPIFTTLGFFYGLPYVILLGDTGFDYSSLFMKRENVAKLRDRIEEKKKERDEKKKETEGKKQREGKQAGLLGWIRGKKEGKN